MFSHIAITHPDHRRNTQNDDDAVTSRYLHRSRKFNLTRLLQFQRAYGQQRTVAFNVCEMCASFEVQVRLAYGHRKKCKNLLATFFYKKNEGEHVLERDQKSEKLKKGNRQVEVRLS